MLLRPLASWPECYIRGVLTLVRRHGWCFAGIALAGALLRLFFIWKMAVVTDDAVFYGEIAKCLIHHHGYGIAKGLGGAPTLSRLPGYPLFLALTFLLGGDDNYHIAMLLQLVFDLWTCLLVADIARRTSVDCPNHDPAWRIARDEAKRNHFRQSDLAHPGGADENAPPP